MFDGSLRAVEDVKAGDQLLGPDSEPRTVLSTTRGTGPLYTVTPVKGRPYTVNDAHLLSLVRTDNGAVETVRADQWSARSATARHLLKGYRSGVVHFAPREKPALDPYAIGVWLGDGSRSAPAITVMPTDEAVVSAWRELAESIGGALRVAQKPGSKAATYFITTGGRGGHGCNAVRNWINVNGLDETKFVPDEYRLGSRRTRAELLAGLLDTDGHLSKGGFDYISVYPQLAEDAAFVARSLGLAAYVTECRKGCQTGYVGNYYRVSISGDVETVPTRLPRKKAGTRQQRKSVLRTGITVAPVGEGEYAGFALDGDHLFLLEDFTVTHNSFVLAANHAVMRPHGLVTVFPSTEIGLGVYKRLGLPDSESIYDLSEAKQQERMESVGLWTVMRYYNALLAGDAELAKGLQFDEGHHTTAATYEAIHAFCGDCPAVMYTATGFRGTPEETAKLKAKWGEIEPILTLPQAVARGFISQPIFRVWPLLNDDCIKVANGEFEVKQTEKELDKVIPALVVRIVDDFCVPGDNGDVYGAFWCEPSRPTMVTAPGVASAQVIGEALAEGGVPAIVLTGSDCVYLRASAADGTPDRLTRQEAFAKVVACKAILVQVNVVSEGVDLPIRVHIDTAPCMSPVRWMQRVGRGTRPVASGEDAPVYVCTNHNLSRHAYQWAGLIPAAQIRDAQKVWGEEYKPSRRTFARALGLEGFGKFKAAKIPMLDGTYAGLYALQTQDGLHQYAVFLHPCRPEPLFFQRTNVHNGEYGEKKLDNGTVVKYKLKDYGKWRRIETIPNADGYVSVKPQAVSERMLAWWQKPAPQRGAEWCGLDPAHEPNAHEFQILPALVDCGIRFKLEDK